MKLTEIRKIEGVIILKTGLHIGSANLEMHIGGTDNQVIKHPHTLEPYIPGSSLKGKIRSLLEMQSGLMIHTNGDVVSGKIFEKIKDNKALVRKAEAILKIFGSSGADKEDETSFGPSRASFADCFLNEEWKKKAIDNNWAFTELKPENVINRIKGTAEHPRTTERVPSGAEFDMLITFKILEDGDDKLFDYLLMGLKLLEMDALGGNVSRGYGRIEIKKLNNEEYNNKFRNINPFNFEI